LVLDPDDLGPDLPDDETRIDQLEVPVDAVWRGEAVDEARGERSAQEAASASRECGGGSGHG